MKGAENGGENKQVKKIISWVVGLPAQYRNKRANELAPLVGAVRGNRGAGGIVLNPARSTKLSNYAKGRFGDEDTRKRDTVTS